MRTTFPTELALLQATRGNPVDLSRIQDECVRTTLEEVRSLIDVHRLEMKQAIQSVLRRTAALSPAKGFSCERYAAQATASSTFAHPAPPSSNTRHHNEPTTSDISHDPHSDINITESESQPQHSSLHDLPNRPELHLPPVEAFCEPGQPALFFPPILGQMSASWSDVFALIKQPKLLWSSWHPSKTVDQFSLEEIWACYNFGEQVFDDDGVQIGIKPPLRLVEQYFLSKWRKGPNQRKQWERFREILEWIESRAASEKLSPRVVIQDLEKMRGEGKKKKGLNALAKEIKELRYKDAREKGEKRKHQFLATSLES